LREEQKKKRNTGPLVPGNSDARQYFMLYTDGRHFRRPGRGGLAKPAEALGVEESALVVEGGDSPSSDLMYSISTSSGLDVSIYQKKKTHIIFIALDFIRKNVAGNPRKRGHIFVRLPNLFVQCESILWPFR
jgi:hypothetical protein